MMTPAQKRDKEDHDLANKMMKKAGEFMNLVNEARDRGLWVSIGVIGYHGDSIRVHARRDFKRGQSKRICDADVGQWKESP